MNLTVVRGADVSSISDLDAALADYLLAREADPQIIPGAFADRLPANLQQTFLAELERLAELDAMVEAPPRDLPQRWSGFRILNLLGQGSNGAVYEAEQVSLRRRVAIKILHPAVATDDALRARFAREARTVAGLHHPSIVAIHEFGECDQRPFLVMQLAPGRSLQALLAARTNVAHPGHAQARAFFADERRLARCFLRIAEALAHAHAHGIVHRDLKPANLVIDDRDHPFILDFGLAREATQQSVALTQDGDVLGTLRYMSPEQMAGATAGPASDLWSLGCVLQECLTGEPPIGAQTPAPAPRSSGLHGIVSKCLQRDAGRRFRSAAEMVTALQRCAARKPGLGRCWARIADLGASTAVRVAVALVVGYLGGMSLSARVVANNTTSRVEQVAREVDRRMQRIELLLNVEAGTTTPIRPVAMGSK